MGPSWTARPSNRTAAVGCSDATQGTPYGQHEPADKCIVITGHLLIPPTQRN